MIYSYDPKIIAIIKTIQGAYNLSDDELDSVLQQEVEKLRYKGYNVNEL
jgi:hypothetical protein